MTKILRKSDTTVGAIPHAWFILLVVGAVAMSGAGNMEMQLEAAKYREVVLGDLKGAMEQYQSILGQTGSPKPVQARAQLQVAECQEKLGHREEARAGYSLVVRQYPDSVEAGTARTKLANWEGSFPGPRNLKFDQGVPGKAPPAWHVPGLPREADQWAQIRRTGCHGDGGCAVMLTPENAPIRAGGLDQSFKAVAYRGKTLRLRAWMHLDRGAPDDYAKMYLNVDSAAGMNCSVDNRSSGWTACEVVTRVGEDASNVDFGFMSFGSANVWIDGVSFEVIPSKP
jgi:hypothetical protein